MRVHLKFKSFKIKERAIAALSFAPSESSHGIIISTSDFNQAMLDLQRDNFSAEDIVVELVN